MNLIKKQQEHFDSISQRYISSRDNERHFLIQDAIWSTLFNSLNLEHKQCYNIIEGMCGTADGYVILENFFPYPFSYQAFDYSKNMVSEAKKRFPKLNIYLGDVTSLNDQSIYDIVIIIGGLHHVYQSREVVAQNISNSLKSNGLFINFEPTHNNFVFKKIREFIYKKNSLFDEETEKDFSTNELNQLFKKVNMFPVVQFYPGLLAYTLWYNPDAFPFLNVGSAKTVNMIIDIEKRLWFSRIARFFSFATLSCYVKNEL